MSPLVSVTITTFNSAPYLPACLASLRDQRYPRLQVIVVDNASTDGTRKILRRAEDRVRVIYNADNLGFAAAQNQAIRVANGDWVLTLNPDVCLHPDFVAQLVARAEQDRSIGVACGKLLRWTPGQVPERTRMIDSTGIYFTRNLRHFDRGAEQPDTGQYEDPAYVFGATGAAALYRKTMIEDVSINGAFFDEEFFAFREDADLAWRAQLFGWNCLYVPTAVAWHVRRVTPSRFKSLPFNINWHSIKNRFLMRAKNISPWLYWRLLLPVTARDILILGYCAFYDRRFWSAITYVWLTRKRLREKRRIIQQRRRRPDSELAHWFGNTQAITLSPAARPLGVKAV